MVKISQIQYGKRLAFHSIAGPYLESVRRTDLPDAATVVFSFCLIECL